jgi:predicted nucleic acid-binding Zn ribbon protein
VVTPLRRRAPEPLAAIVRDVVAGAAPDTLLARVQGLWSEVAGPAIAAEATPASEREGTVTVHCSSGVWAQELTLLEPELVGRLNARLEGLQVRSLRFKVTAP